MKQVGKQLRAMLAKMNPRQQQYLMAAGALTGGVGVFWAVLAFSASPTPPSGTAGAPARERVVTNPELAGGVTPMQVNPVDQWLGTAGKEMAQYKVDKEAQDKFNADRQSNEAALMRRLSDIEKRELDRSLASVPASPAEMAPAPIAAAPPPPPSAPPLTYPPGSPVGPMAAPLPPGVQAMPRVEPEAQAMERVSLGGGAGKEAPVTAQGGTGAAAPAVAGDTLASYLPVSFVRGQLLGGLDAPTGGQAQSNPQPVLIRLLDNAVLPNRYRAQVKECFVIAAGYGDISSERAYLRTSNLSCVRYDRSVLEVKIEGNVYGEDGKVGMRGRLVTKQGQLLANALRAGIVGGIGQGFAQGGSTFTASPLGTLSTSPQGTAEQMRRGMAGGVGRALDNLANYYIKLAEQTFPVIEIDGARQVDIVITRGVRMPAALPEGRDAPTGDDDALAD
ncbi:TrbI/VirB10 family protein [Pseudoduganella violacea]|uniref:Conjugal transfer pilus assembly protein TraB n=1 Tax=Pseudoduganella violacea TaxID=1715466 RepID=A0A7W5BFF6_9BURK|nr:TrbI/VirB10 family protein [Pseudoduganella violacea]MBB3122176.1 conjugal transfer pilus assembly protein TraB [Pseudoduganella violacea]